jgi:hypothetical protein
MKEFSFIVGQEAGSLAGIAAALGEEHVNIEGIAGVNVLEEAVIRMVTDDLSKTRTVLRNQGVDYEENETLSIDLANHPGNLATLLQRLATENVNILSCYAAVERNTLLLTVDQVDRTKEILRID